MMIHHGLLPERVDRTPRCPNCRSAMKKDHTIKVHTGNDCQMREAQVWRCLPCHTMRILKVVP